MTMIGRLLSGTVVAGAATLAMSQGAWALPYAFASNQLTNILIAASSGSFGSTVTASSEQGVTSAQYNGIISGFNSPPTDVGTTNDVLQATAGPGPFPGENDFAARAGASIGMIGSRADGLITGGAAGHVSASDVAESRGNAVGSAQGKNTASINFTATLAAPGQVSISFDDLFYLEAASSLPGETANATIKNDFLITNAATGARVFEFTPNGTGASAFGGTVISDPFNINGQANSTSGAPPNPIFTDTGFFSAISDLLPAGTYNIAIVSSSQTSIGPGVAVPEPASLALFGVGLLGLGMTVARRRRVN